MWKAKKGRVSDKGSERSGFISKCSTQREGVALDRILGNLSRASETMPFHLFIHRVWASQTRPTPHSPFLITLPLSILPDHFRRWTFGPSGQWQLLAEQFNQPQSPVLIQLQAGNLFLRAYEVFLYSFATYPYECGIYRRKSETQQKEMWSWGECANSTSRAPGQDWTWGSVWSPLHYNISSIFRLHWSFVACTIF